MILFDFVFGFPFQLAACLVGAFSSCYAVYLGRRLTATDRKLPNLLRILAYLCFCVASLRLTILLLPQSSNEWKFAYIILSIARICLVNFGTALATVIAIYVAYVCSSEEFEQSIHSISYSYLLVFAVLPLLTRGIQNIVFTDFGVTFDHIRLKANFLSDDQTQNEYSCYVIAAIMILYFLAGLLTLLFFTWKLFKKLRNPGKLSALKKWRLSCNLACYFSLIISVPLARQILVGLVEYWFRDDIDLSNFLSSILLLAVPTFLTDSTGLFMILALIRCRSKYSSSLDVERAVVIVEGKRMDASYKDLRAETAASDPPLSQPPAIDYHPQRFLDDTSSTAQLASNNHTPHAHESSDPYANLPRFVNFMNETDPTKSQLSNVGAKIADLPEIDFYNLL